MLKGREQIKALKIEVDMLGLKSNLIPQQIIKSPT